MSVLPIEILFLVKPFEHIANLFSSSYRGLQFLYSKEFSLLFNEHHLTRVYPHFQNRLAKNISNEKQILSKIKGYKGEDFLWEYVIDQDGRPDVIISRRGLTELNSGNIDLAYDYLNEAVEKNPYFGEGFFNLGLFMEKTGKIDNAIELYKKAFQLHKHDAFANRLFLLILQRKTGKLSSIICRSEYQLAFQRFLNSSEGAAFKADYLAFELSEENFGLIPC